jgi:hypothetical protein
MNHPSSLRFFLAEFWRFDRRATMQTLGLNLTAALLEGLGFASRVRTRPVGCYSRTVSGFSRWRIGILPATNPSGFPTCSSRPE